MTNGKINLSKITVHHDKNSIFGIQGFYNVSVNGEEKQIKGNADFILDNLKKQTSLIQTDILFTPSDPLRYITGFFTDRIISLKFVYESLKSTIINQVKDFKQIADSFKIIVKRDQYIIGLVGVYEYTN